MTLQFNALPGETVRDIRASKTDAYGNPVEVHVSDGSVYPCRHCLGEIPRGRQYLILAHRPFTTSQPYAETGPIFLCADGCTRHEPTEDTPEILRAPNYLVRGYDRQERIIYGTGSVVPTHEITAYAGSLFARTDVAFADVRSASNNCFLCRITRA